MSKPKNKAVDSTGTVVPPGTPNVNPVPLPTTPSLSPAERAANRVIGPIEDVAPPTGRGGAGIAPVWKQTLEPLPVGKSFTVTGIGEKSLLQSVVKIGKKNWPERKFKVWVEKTAEQNGGVEVLRVGRLEDREIKKEEPKQEVTLPPLPFQTPAPTPIPEQVQTVYTAENPPPGYYYDPNTNQFLPYPAQQGMQGV